MVVISHFVESHIVEWQFQNHQKYLDEIFDRFFDNVGLDEMSHRPSVPSTRCLVDEMSIRRSGRRRGGFRRSDFRRGVTHSPFDVVYNQGNLKPAEIFSNQSLGGKKTGSFPRLDTQVGSRFKIQDLFTNKEHKIRTIKTRLNPEGLYVCLWWRVLVRIS